MASPFLHAVVGQRLVRKICEGCKTPETLSSQTLKRLEPYLAGVKAPSFWKGAGCEACQFTGYVGRMGIFELLSVTPTLRERIGPGFSALQLKKAAEKEGFEPMTRDGIRKALQGLTTMEEVFRVAPPELEGGVETGAPGLPAVEETPLEQMVPEQESPSLTMARPKKILVADDSEMILKILRNVLEAENFLVLTAENGLEALRLILKEKPDLVVTDCLMPEMDGLALVRKLRSQLSTRYIPIIMLTAKDEVDSEVKGIEAGADDYLTKPVDPKRLLARIQRLLTRSAGE